MSDRAKFGEAKQRICAAFDANPLATSKQLAELTGERPEYVRVALQRSGRKLARTRTASEGARRLQEWERQAILDGVKEGEKYAALGAEFGVTESTICLIATSNGLSRKRAVPLTKYRSIGFEVETERAVGEFARQKNIGFGEAVRRLITTSLHTLND